MQDCQTLEDDHRGTGQMPAEDSDDDGEQQQPDDDKGSSEQPYLRFFAFCALKPKIDDVNL